MIPADVLNSLKTLLLSQKPLSQVAPVTAVTPELELGQKFQATVLAQMSPGIFKVQVADQLMQLQLPNTIRSGDKITLQVVSLLPRLTFSMAASADPLSTADKLSAASRLLSSLTQQPQANSFLRPANNTPLLAVATQFPDTSELAGKLHATISQSGLFYESHQAQWLAGSRNTAQLLLEPQNLPADQFKLALNLGDRTSNTASLARAQPSEFHQTKSAWSTGGQTSAAATPAKIHGTELFKDITQPPQLAQNPKADQGKAVLYLDNETTSTNIEHTQNNSAAVLTSHEKVLIPGIPEHLHPLIQQQLNALETRQVLWQGQIWPEQEMNWRIREETTHSPDGEEGRQWATQINLDLPNLGEVTATLRFGNNGLSVTLEADKEDTRSKLGTATSTLVAVLAERGIPTASALVTQHDNI